MRSAFEWNGLEVAYRRAVRGRRSCFCMAPRRTGASGNRSSRAWPTSSPCLVGRAGRGRVVRHPRGLRPRWLRGLPRRPDRAPRARRGACRGSLVGRTVALELYRRRPDLVTSLVMIDSYAGWKGSLPEEEVRARVEGTRQMMAAPAIRPHAPGPVRRRSAGGVRAAAGEGGRRRPPGQPQGAAVTMAEADLNDVLPTITVPTLLVWGELDARSPLAVAHHFQQAIPGAR